MKIINIGVMVCLLIIGCYTERRSVKMDVHDIKYQYEFDIDVLTAYYNEQEPIFLDLKYVDSTEIKSYGNYYTGKPADAISEFTWWVELTYYDYNTAMEYIKDCYDINLPEYDIEDGRVVVFSLGRKLKQLYYYELSKAYTYDGHYIGRPVFEEEHHPFTIFIYTINAVENYGFDNEVCTNDMAGINEHYNVPFSVQSFEPMGGMGDIPIDNVEIQRRRFEELFWRGEKKEY